MVAGAADAHLAGLAACVCRSMRIAGNCDCTQSGPGCSVITAALLVPQTEMALQDVDKWLLTILILSATFFRWLLHICE